MTRHGLTGGALVTSVLLASDPTAAQSPSDADKIERLERQVDLLQKQLTALQGEIRQTKKKKTEPTQPPRHPQTQQVGEQQVGEEIRPAAEPKKTETAAAGRVEFPHGRPTITSADGGISLAIGEQFQYDVGGYFQAKRSGVFEPPGAQELNNGVNLRRGRIYFVGTFDAWTARITPEFGGFPDGAPTLFEANLNYTYGPITATIGYFKPYDTLARSQFPGDALFLERPSIALIASNVADGIERASAGFKASTEDYFIASYLTGPLYGAQRPVLLNNEQAGATLRLATRPFRGDDWNLHVGFSGSTAFNFNKSNFQPGGSPEGIRLSDQPELRIDFNPLIDTGFIPAKSALTWGFELAANWRNFLVQGEYIGIEVNPTVGKDLNFAGWYLEGSWVLTGESRPYLASSATYGSPVPYRPFEIGGGWGAWELAGRYSVTDLNSGVVFGGQQTIVSAALSWYATEHVRFTLQGSHVDVDRRDPIRSVQVGQSFWDVALRTQVVY
jgi:phosphate-selective porin OprO and OprP